MSSSWSCEVELRKLAEELHRKAEELEQAADTLKVLREKDDMKAEIEKAKAWAKQWMGR